MWPYRWGVLLTIGCIVLSNLLALVLPWGIKVIIDEVFPNGNLVLLRSTMGVLLAAIIGRTVLSFMRRVKSDGIGECVMRDLKRDIYQRFLRMPLTTIKEITPTQLLSRLTGDAENIRRFIFGDIIEGTYAVMSVGVILAVLLWINVRLTMVALLVLPFFGFIYVRAIPGLKTGYRRLRDVQGRLTVRMNEVLHGMAVVRSFAAEDREREKFDTDQEENLRLAKHNYRLNGILWVGIEFFTTLGVVGVLWGGGRDVLAGRMTPGALVAFYSYLGMLFTPVIRLVTVNSSYQEAAASLKRVMEVLAWPEERPAGRVRVALKNAICFEDVHFAYKKSCPVLRGVRCRIETGQVVGIVGASGVGKTTWVSLLLGFLNPCRGVIRLDGVSLREIDVQWYRRQVAVVLQDDYLFSGTIRENICYGRPGASFPEVVKAARAARADDFIQRLPAGYETEIGEEGKKLSSGQRQRLAIARALLRRPKILILDEATSALDAMTENHVQEAVRQWMKGGTVIIVAHRFSTIMDADRILVLGEGSVVDQGTHRDLMDKRGFYYRLYMEQFKREDQRQACRF